MARTTRRRSRGERKTMKTKGACKCYYRGNEPSPRGRGFCAHCGHLGQTKRGRDGMLWKIEKRVSGALYWKKMARGRR